MKYLLFCVAMLLIFSLCNDDNPAGPTNDPANGYIEVTVPAGGETYTVGNTVKLEFKVNADKVIGVIPAVSIDGGMTWKDIPAQQVSTSGTGGQLLSYSWVIGSEIETVSYQNQNSQCKIKVYDYNDGTKNDVSETFTIVK